MKRQRKEEGLLVNIIKHGFEKTTKRPLILVWDTAVLIDDLGLYPTQACS